jgi:hypothetical protein
MAIRAPIVGCADHPTDSISPPVLPIEAGLTKGVGLIVVLISLAVSGVLFSMQSSGQGPTASAVTQEESQAIAVAAASIFAQVTQVLQVDYAQAGTYVDAQLPTGSGVTLAQASATAYCLQANVNGTPVHETGPGGSPVLGLCSP